MSRARNSRTHRSRIIRWTAAEEQIVIDEIGKNPTCLKAAFLAASAQMTRTPNACSYHWYKYMATRDDVVAKLTIGNGVAIKNKTVKIAQDSPLRTSIGRAVWDAILKFLFSR